MAEERDILAMCETEERLRLEKLMRIKQRLKERFAQVPENCSLVDELIVERRAAAKRE
jgi:hypothetical protein